MGDVNFEYLVKVVSARFLHCELGILLLLLLMDILCGDILAVYKYPIFKNHTFTC